MKKMISDILILLFVGVSILISCKKEYSCEGCAEKNKPPIAAAGSDQGIILPTDSISLDGSASSDPDGTISKWLWTKISGPASFNIIRHSDSISKVKALVVGVYLFELKVTDNGGLSAKDTVQVIVNYSSISNRPPVANAGTDQMIFLPTNAITLNGNGSTDPDNNITSYLWAKISGPLSFNIASTNTVQTQVTDLIQGIYQFELKVTDAGGLFSKDTIQITVNAQSLPPACDNSNRPLVNAQLIPVGAISQQRIGMAVASAGTKILFAGGWETDPTANWPSSRVDIYDMGTQVWSTAELCIGRYDIAAIAAGNKIFFGAGEYGDGTWPLDSVDIYDILANTWTVTHLSSAGHSIAAGTVGNKVFFAGGDQGFSGTPGINRARQVDIYDLTTSTWSTALLSEGRRGLTAVAANNKIYFAGGGAGNQNCASSTIDIYDNTANTWSTSVMQEGKSRFATIEIAGKIYWAGGGTGNSCNYNSCAVEIRDVATGNSTLEYLFRPGYWSIDAGQNAVVKDNKIIFYRAYGNDTNKFDIYDIITKTWQIGVLPVSIEGASIIAVNNTIYIAGGKVNGVFSSQVWKLEF